LDVLVNVGTFGGAPSSLIAAAVRRTLEQEGVGRGEVSVTLLDDESIRALNRDHLGADRPTDVIAFSLGDAEPLGDVYVGFERARAQAEEHGVSLEEELVRLAVHGTLHVLGMEHPDGAERVDSPMFEVQERLVREILEAS
jgi:probable rRNA maturation factor